MAFPSQAASMISKLPDMPCPFNHVVVKPSLMRIDRTCWAALTLYPLQSSLASGRALAATATMHVLVFVCTDKLFGNGPKYFLPRKAIAFAQLQFLA